MKNFVLIFHGYISRGHIDKELVEIPNGFKNNGFKSSIYYVNEDDFAYKNSASIGNEYNGINIYPIQKKDFFGVNIEIIKYLIKNSRSIEILTLIHFIKCNIIYGLIYKLLNPKGKLYIKMDFDPGSHDLKTVFGSKNKYINKVLYKLVNYFIKKCDLISVESKKGYEFLIEYNKQFQKKLEIIPNGINTDKINEIIPKIKTFEEKENIIITVGRIGTHQKNTEFLLEALSKVDLKDWIVYIIGPIEKDFVNYTSEYFNKNKNLINRIIFTGPIYDKKELYEYYNKSKIFCLSSRNEGYPIVSSEALIFGNYIVTSNISSAEDFTDNGKYGKIIEQGNINDYSNEIQRLINNNSILMNLNEELKKYAKKNYEWSNIILKIIEKLELK
ncbi:MAG: glycosyltransferase family 4 protein [Candidatus Absconditabacteria bacterium]